MSTKPTTRPARPQFSSGPCAKRPGWSFDALGNAALGRSHRAKIGKEKLAGVIEKSKSVLGMPKDYRLGIVAGSDTGAFEMAMWSMLGARGIDAMAWESFGDGWITDIQKQLKLDAKVQRADYGEICDLGAVNFDNDVIFTWNGTTSGVRVPNGEWIPSDRKGLTFCDATSAVFAMDLTWDKIDVATWSWQKVLGGEGGHGMLALSPRAVERLQSYTPSWPMPKIFRMTKKGKLDEEIFQGSTINTPSMLCVEDALDSLNWAEGLGGIKGLIARSESNLAAIASWIGSSKTFAFLASDPKIRSCTSICLKIIDPWFEALGGDERAAAVKKMVSLLEKEGVAYDIAGYRDAPAGLRIWGGATVERSDIEALLPWLDWAFAEAKG